MVIPATLPLSACPPLCQPGRSSPGHRIHVSGQGPLLRDRWHSLLIRMALQGSDMRRRLVRWLSATGGDGGRGLGSGVGGTHTGPGPGLQSWGCDLPEVTSYPGCTLLMNQSPHCARCLHVHPCLPLPQAPGSHMPIGSTSLQALGGRFLCFLVLVTLTVQRMTWWARCGMALCWGSVWRVARG